VSHLAVSWPSCRGISDAGAGERGSRPAAPMRAMALASPPAELRVQALHTTIRAVLSRPSSRGRVFAGDCALESLPAAPQRAKASTAPWRRTACRASTSRRAPWRVNCEPAFEPCVRACVRVSPEEGGGAAETHPSAVSRAAPSRRRRCVRQRCRRQAWRAAGRRREGRTPFSSCCG
jgi:hypothetical protein